MESKPKVLVCTIDAWSSRTGADTFSSLLQHYGAENVASLYIRADIADSTSASRYFQIVEGKVLKSIFSRNVITGKAYSLGELTESHDLSEEKARYNSFRKHRWGIFLFAREFVWKLGSWKSHELNKFLDDFKPDVVIFPIEHHIHFNTLTEYIVDRCRPKVISFLWDDNFTYKQDPHNIWHLIHRFWCRKGVRRLVEKSEIVFALSPKMKEECDKEFGIDSVLLTKPIFNQGEFRAYRSQMPIRILYTGNLLIERDKTIMAIADALRIVNNGENRIVLDVYTNTALSQHAINKITNGGVCTIHPPVPQSEVFKLQEGADILLFAESLDTKKHQDARLSFSTKITDYFRAGRCIWAVASPTLGPLDYLMRMDAALISTDKPSILNVLNNIVKNPNIICQYAEKGFRCGKEHHDGNTILNTFYNAIIS